MPVKIYWVYESETKGRIGIMARPRGNEWLKEEINSLKKQRVDILVSLLESEEVAELGLHEEQNHCTDFDIAFISFSIKDRDIPPKGMAVKTLFDSLYNSIKAGNSIVIHCRMGIGRSSVITAAIMKKIGFKTDSIFQHISKLRGLSVPDTKEQEKWISEQNN